MKEQPTSAAIVKFISFEKFVSLIPEINEETEVYDFDALMVSGSIFGKTAKFEEGGEATYQRKALRLLIGMNNLIFKNNLYLQGHICRWFKEDLQEMVENAVMKHLNEYGQPQYLVHIDHRTWMPANPHDFKIVKGKYGVGLACLYPGRTFMVEIKKETYEEVVDMLNKQGVKTSKEEYKKQIGVTL